MPSPALGIKSSRLVRRRNEHRIFPRCVTYLSIRLDHEQSRKLELLSVTRKVKLAWNSVQERFETT